MAVPNNPYLPMVAKAAIAAGIDPRWAQAILLTENAPGNPVATSSAGAVGLMQILPASAPGVNLDNPQANIDAGVKILSANLRAAGGNKSRASAMYFDGPNAKTFGPDAYSYVQKVANNYNSLGQETVPNQVQEPSQTPALDALLEKAQSNATQESPGTVTSNNNSEPNSQTPALDALMGGAQTKITQAQSSPQPSLGQKVLAGSEEGIHALTDVPAEALAGGVGGIMHALGYAPDWHPEQTTKANDKAANGQYQQDMARYPAAEAANAATQILGGAAILGSGEGIVNAAADGAKAALTGTGAEVAGNAAQGAARFLAGRAGTGVVGKGLSLAAQGATQTAAFDALTGRPISAAGIGVGAAANPILAGAGSVVGEKISDAVSALTPKQTQAARVVAGALSRDGLGAQDLAAIGRNGNALLDVSGPNTQLLARSISQRPGEGATQLTNALENNVQSAPIAVRGAVQSALGSNGDIYDLDASVADQQKLAATPLYEKAYSVGPLWNDKLASLLNRPSVAAAWSKAQNIAGDEGIKLPQVFTTDQSGQITGIKSVPDMQTWDYIKRGLDDVVQANKNQLTGKIETDSARSANNVKNELLDALDEANPDYAQARAAYAGPAKVREAIQMGRKVFNQDSEATQGQIAKMSPSEKSAFQAGVARAVLDKLPDPTQTGKNAVGKLLNTPQVSAKLKAAFDNPQQFDNFSQLLNDIGNQAGTRNEVLKGSQTAKTLAAQGHNWVSTGSRAVLNALAGNHLGAIADLGSGVLAQRGVEGDPALNNEIAKLLTSQDRSNVASQMGKALPSATLRALSGSVGAGYQAGRLYGVPALLQPQGSY